MTQKFLRCLVAIMLALSLSLPAATVGASSIGQSGEVPFVSEEAVMGSSNAPSPEAAVDSEDISEVIPSAPSSGGVLISHVLTGTAESASHEVIELFNNSDMEADITGWCVYYYSASAVERSTCFTPVGAGYRLILPAKSHLVLASNDLVSAYPSFARDGVVVRNGLAETGGAVVLRSDVNQMIDALSWGGSVTGEGEPAAAPSMRGVALERRLAAGNLYQDTGSNKDDFSHAEVRPIYQAGALEEVVDYCVNLSLIQESIPEGMYRDEVSGECREVPYVVVNECPGVVISEIAANHSRQFIELHNTSSEAVELGGCVLQTNRSKTAAYVLPEKILAGSGYEVIYIDETKLTLTKTTAGTVYLLSSDFSQELDVQSYEGLAAGTSWSKFDDIWRQTYTPTPGSGNVNEAYAPCGNGYYRSEETGRCRKQLEAALLAKCPAGKVRNLETNRCRTVGGSGSVLKPCNKGQYRHPETNRCRNIASSTSQLVPCKPGQYRSSETNRCRSLDSGGNQLKPCKEGQERNPETNRCRKVRGGSVPAAAFAAIPVADTPEAVTGWWLFGGITTLAAGYAGWEWRREMAAAIRRVASIFTSRG